MAKIKIAFIKGDGIGPEVSYAAEQVLSSASKRFGFDVEIVNVEAGDSCLEKRGVALPKDSLEKILNCEALLKGPVGSTAMDVVVRLRQILDVYANIRPVKNYPTINSVKQGVDFVIVRENTEDLYKGFEFEVNDFTVALKVISRKACERIAKFGFELARKRRKKILIVHKSNVLRVTDGFFAKICREVSKLYPDVKYSEMLVDACAMHIIRAPEKIDVLLTLNMYGDILSDEAAQIVGGLGLAPSANIGDKYALFEPVHGAAPDIAGKGIANPLSMILTVKMMLDYFGDKKNDYRMKKASQAIEEGVISSLKNDVKTPDIGGNSKTKDVTAYIANFVREYQQ